MFGAMVKVSTCSMLGHLDFIFQLKNTIMYRKILTMEHILEHILICKSKCLVFYLVCGLGKKGEGGCMKGI